MTTNSLFSATSSKVPVSQPSSLARFSARDMVRFEIMTPPGIFLQAAVATAPPILPTPMKPRAYFAIVSLPFMLIQGLYGCGIRMSNKYCLTVVKSDIMVREVMHMCHFLYNNSRLR